MTCKESSIMITSVRVLFNIFKCFNFHKAQQRSICSFPKCHTSLPICPPGLVTVEGYVVSWVTSSTDQWQQYIQVKFTFKLLPIKNC
jgi:hypothetical protein